MVVKFVQSANAYPPISLMENGITKDSNLEQPLNASCFIRSKELGMVNDFRLIH